MASEASKAFGGEREREIRFVGCHYTRKKKKKKGLEKGEPNSPSLSDTVSVSGEWDFPPARAGAPGRKAYRRGSITRIQGLGADPNEVVRARAEYEGDKFAKSAVETVRSRLSWWRQRAVENYVEPYPLTVEKQLFGSLLKRAGYRSAAAYTSAVKNQHVRLGHPWSDALDLELRDGNPP